MEKLFGVYANEGDLVVEALSSNIKSEEHSSGKDFIIRISKGTISEKLTTDSISSYELDKEMPLTNGVIFLTKNKDIAYSYYLKKKKRFETFCFSMIEKYSQILERLN